MNQGLYEHQESSPSSPRHRNKPYFILFTIIALFTVIIFSIATVFAVLKHRIESEYPATTTDRHNLVKEICGLAPYDRRCNKSMSPLDYHHTNDGDEISSADVLRLSISAAYNELYVIRSLAEELRSAYKNSPGVEKALANCRARFEGSLERLNESLIAISEHHFEAKRDSTFFIRNYDEVVITTKATDFIDESMENLQMCVNGLERINGSSSSSAKWNLSGDKKSFESRVNESTEYLLNALALLENKEGLDKILFRPNFLSIFANSLMLNCDNSYAALVLFSSQYLLLMLMLCVLLRVFPSQKLISR